jgi:hypothetical protein
LSKSVKVFDLIPLYFNQFVQFIKFISYLTLSFY